MAGWALRTVLLGLMVGAFGDPVLASGHSPVRAKDVKAWPDPAIVEPLSVRLWPDRSSGQYSVGDPVQLYVKVTQDCHLTLVNVGTSGRVSIVFPNPFHPDNLVRAGILHALAPSGSGWRFTASRPPGREVVMAICTLGPEATPPVPYGLRATGRDVDSSASDISHDRWAVATITLEVAPPLP